jgi:hypothetical protein
VPLVSTDADPVLLVRPAGGQRGAARPVAYRPRNQLIGVALVAALAVVILQLQLSLPLVTLFGLDGSRLAVTCVAVVALALPLAMADAPADAAPTGWFLLTRRNLILSLTVLVIVANWYGDRGLSFLPIAALVIGLPLLIGFSRVIAAGGNASSTASSTNRSAPDSDPIGCNWPTCCCSAHCWPSPCSPGRMTP